MADTSDQAPTQEHLAESVDNGALASAVEALLKDPRVQTLPRTDGSIERKLSTSELTSFAPIDVETSSQNGEITYRVTQWDDGLSNENYSWTNATDASVGVFQENGERSISRDMSPADYSSALRIIDSATELFKGHRPSLRQRASRALGSVVRQKAS